MPSTKNTQVHKLRKPANGKSVTNTASKRKGKDLSHKKALSKGGSNKDGVTLESPSKNRARNYQSKKKITVGDSPTFVL